MSIELYFTKVPVMQDSQLLIEHPRRGCFQCQIELQCEDHRFPIQTLVIRLDVFLNFIISYNEYFLVSSFFVLGAESILELPLGTWNLLTFTFLNLSQGSGGSYFSHMLLCLRSDII